jgi:hypothetical protein
MSSDWPVSFDQSNAISDQRTIRNTFPSITNQNAKQQNITHEKSCLRISFLKLWKNIAITTAHYHKVSNVTTIANVAEFFNETKLQRNKTSTKRNFNAISSPDGTFWHRMTWSKFVLGSFNCTATPTKNMNYHTLNLSSTSCWPHNRICKRSASRSRQGQ